MSRLFDCFTLSMISVFSDALRTLNTTTASSESWGLSLRRWLDDTTCGSRVGFVRLMWVDIVSIRFLRDALVVEIRFICSLRSFFF